MAEALKVAVVLLVLTAPLVLTQERCSYMTAIPREPKPDDLPPIEWTGGWSARPLIPASERDDLCMDEYFPAGTASGIQIIYLDEEIVGDVVIARLNYQGSETPYIVRPLLSGTFNLLGPEIRFEDGEWNLYITQRQDFETPGMQQYMFNVRIDGETLVATVSLQIVNIDDNDPIIQVFDTCVVPELGEPRLTECVYEVSDADGEISTRFMTFRIDSDRGDDQIFYIQGTNMPNDWFRMNMTLGLNSSLNFENNALHIFQVTALDSLPNTHTVTLMVQVENVEHRPPRWVDIFAVQQFDEKTYQNFTVRAIDGDTGINKPIYYRLNRAVNDTFFSIETIEGGRDGAIFHVAPIDRDTLERETFQLSIVAYKYDNESFATEAEIVIIVNDVNDQRPRPLHEEYFVSFREETPLTLNFEEEFGFHDRDLGIHAQYEVHLESEYPPGAEEAFYIAPEIGYQRQTFVMGTLNHSMLDYEIPEFQHISLKVIATDIDNRTHTGVAYVYIDLINWNDELPIFNETVQTVSFDETVGEGFYVGTVWADDRDIDDRVEHSLMGNAGDYLRINISTGDIYVSIDDAFDYHRQNELFVQVRADDTLMEPFHTATSQLVIQLKDINNTPPTLRLPRGSPAVEENVPEGFPITQEIIATDPDTTAYLQFEIDWETSYATKQGRETPPEEFHGCVDIETIFPDPSTNGSAIGRVVAKEIRYNVTIDFEEFEVLYLTVRVRDLNTVIGLDYDESTFTIIIIDMNDNAPIWVNGTLTQAFRVRELAGSDIVIGSVLATDIDGPLYNQVRYTIFPREDTPENLVKIDFYTGQISVDNDGAIDADIPPRWNLYYTVIASDKCYAEDSEDCPPDPNFWDTEGNITIQIIDTNNKIPYADTTKFSQVVYVYENVTDGYEVVQLFSNDLDRDEMYNTGRYQINYAVNPRLRDFFEIDLVTGNVTVLYTTNDVLDRDGDEPEHRIFFTILDNFLSEGDGNRNQNETEVLVVLLDVNDNAPELPEPHELSWSISEGLTQGVRLQPDIYAPDRDEPDTDNSRVGYAILSLNIQNREIEVPELFTMIQIQNVTGELETTMDLRGYWGTYAIHILAYDHGIPQQSSNETYELVIRPYNFHEPVFVYPIDGTTVRLARERATANGLLATVSGAFLDRIAATDEDGLHAGQVTFEVTGNADAVNYFYVTEEMDNFGTLMLRQLVPEDVTEFQVTITATDGGTEPGPLSAQSTLTVVFVPTQGDPIFATNTFSVAFFEREGGLLERFELPRAEDPKNYRCDGDCLEIYYRILDGNDAGHFGLDPVENVIFLNTELDRNESTTHVLTIAASNSLTPGAPLSGATLTLTVNVREAHPRPYFETSLYIAGISALDTINRELLVVRAIHSEGEPLTYSIDSDSMVVDPSLEAVKESAFSLNAQTGVLSLNMQPNAAMHGMFEFYVIATDPAGETDNAVVRIYLISSLNRISFIFLNTVEQIERNRDFIAQTFSTGFNMSCSIDQVVPASDSNGVALSDRTDVRAHFIVDNEPVGHEHIEELRSDTQLLRNIQTTLSTELLVLSDVVTDSSPEIDSDSNLITVYVLAGLSIILAFMVLILLLTFIIRTRALNRRLEALSMTKYGSVDSGLNRAGLAAPGTNKHAVEGSNPIWNEVIKAPDFDAISDASGDSDLIGIEDMPQFRSDYFPEDADSVRDIVNPQNGTAPVASHDNNFGFYTSPFSPDFTNEQFRSAVGNPRPSPPFGVARHGSFSTVTNY